MIDTTLPATSPVTQVHRFYEFVDSGDTAAMAALFAPGAVYRRPGYEPWIGPEGLYRFYTEERVIREGAHTLTTVVERDGHVAVFGEHHGVLKDDRPVDLRFADYFAVRPDGLITSRDTYFFAPLA